jgi:hemin uptake protein HemP
MLAKARDHEPGSRDDLPDAPGASGGRKIRVCDLMSNERQVTLEHAGELYILRITAKGRLILTK